MHPNLESRSIQMDLQSHKKLERKYRGSMSLLLDKYSQINDEDDDEIDIFNLEITKNRGQLKKASKVEVGCLLQKHYRRIRSIKPVKINISHFDFLFDNLFHENSFDRLFNNICATEWGEFESLYKKTETLDPSYFNDIYFEILGKYEKNILIKKSNNEDGHSMHFFYNHDTFEHKY